LEFYKDEDDYVEKPPKPPKPRRSKFETDEDFNTQILE
jgi:hypothetical protein